MKKIFINIFVLTLAILLTACGNGLNTKKSASNKANTNSVVDKNSISEDLSTNDGSSVETTDESIQIDVAQGSNKVTTNSTEGATQKETSKAVTTQQPVKTTKPATTTKTTTRKPVQTTKAPTTTKPSTAQQPTYDGSFTSEVLRLVNIERANANLAPLGTSNALNQAAQVRANELIQLFAHERPDGRSIWTVLDECGISRRTSGENIAVGQTTPAQVVEGWMNSPGHRANILNANFTQLGVGYAKTNTGYKHHWAQMFIG